MTPEAVITAERLKEYRDQIRRALYHLDAIVAVEPKHMVFLLDAYEQSAALKSEIKDFCAGHVEAVPDKEGRTRLEVGGALGWGMNKHFPTFFEYAVPRSAEDTAEREESLQRRRAERAELAALRAENEKLSGLLDEVRITLADMREELRGIELADADKRRWWGESDVR